ncbi:RES family NAD+ phosphorylase [Rugamonas aquatica]|uniref:RES family NAD+ phosphorylase n=1 Tax=Rugamonas aquatica TaxID=2743357 RepID=UPI002E25A0B1
MTHSVWRIATDAPDYTSDDLNGAGARLSGGRWNRKGTSMLYCAESIALASLETVAHLVATSLPLYDYLVRVDVPDDVMDALLHLQLANAPVGWDSLPPGRVSLDFGTHWTLGDAVTGAVRDRTRGTGDPDQSRPPRHRSHPGYQGTPVALRHHLAALPPAAHPAGRRRLRR